MDRMALPEYEGMRIVARQDELAPFQWMAFYEAVGGKLLDYANDRRPLVEALHEIASRVPGMGHLNDRFSEGRKGPLEDICPFTVFGTFNKGLKDENRQAIAAELAGALG
jgi:AAA ATPase superfamily